MAESTESGPPQMTADISFEQEWKRSLPIEPPRIHRMVCGCAALMEDQPDGSWICPNCDQGVVVIPRTLV